MELEGDKIKSKKASKRDRTLNFMKKLVKSLRYVI